jgi:hypothetical protein
MCSTDNGLGTVKRGVVGLQPKHDLGGKKKRI